jgi:acid phosphatase
MRAITRRIFVSTAVAALAAAVLSCFGQNPTPAPAASPQAASVPLRFLVVGDWGGKAEQRTVAAAMAAEAAERPVRFVISTGDNFYSRGVVSVDDPQWKTTWEDAYAAPSLRVPWYVVLGNHDWKGSAQAQIDYGKTHPKWRMPAHWFTETAAVDPRTRVQFFFLDTTPFDEKDRTEADYKEKLSGVDTTPQVKWLDEALGASTAGWKIVVGHHTIASASPKHGDTPGLRKAIKPLLEKHHVLVYLNGHDHDLQHLVEDGVNYFTSGGGSEFRETGRDARTRFAAGSTGFLAATLYPDRLEARFIDGSGKSLYETSVAR